MGVGNVNFMEIFCNIWEKGVDGCLRRCLKKIPHLFNNFFQSPPPPYIRGFNRKMPMKSSLRDNWPWQDFGYDLNVICTYK